MPSCPCLFPLTEDVHAGIERWKEAITSCPTMSRLHVLMGMLDSCVKWERSAENAVGYLAVLLLVYDYKTREMTWFGGETVGCGNLELVGIIQRIGRGGFPRASLFPAPHDNDSVLIHDLINLYVLLCNRILIHHKMSSMFICYDIFPVSIKIPMAVEFSSLF